MQRSLMVKTLKTITEIHSYYKTNGKRPVLVLCNDMNFYVCKHKYYGSTFSLFLEYLASSFLKLWKIPTPDFAFIEVQPEHIERCIDNDLQPIYFRNTCFGSYKLHFPMEIDAFVSLIKKEKAAKIQQYDFLNIALFDLWMANEDRNGNNANLLLNFEEDGWYFYAIDHEKCFNSNSGMKLEPLTEEDTILAHDLFHLLFKKRQNYGDMLEKLFCEFEKNVELCKSNLSEILTGLPEDWDIDINTIKMFLDDNIFNEHWIQETERKFRFYFDYYLNQ